MSLPDDPTIGFIDLARAQVRDAIAAGRRDLSGAPRWPYPDLDRLIGPALPGRLWIVGAREGNGKTALMLSCMQAWADRGYGVLYFPLELDPEELRRRWAAWALEYEWEHLDQNAWDLLPRGAQEKHEAMMATQAEHPNVFFPDDQRPTLADLHVWIEAHRGEELPGRKYSRTPLQIVIIDHFHRMGITGPGDHRVNVSEVVRNLKDLARRQQITILATCQLNRESHVLDKYLPPTINRLKETAALGEEADVVLMLSRTIKGEISPQTAALVRLNQISEADIADPNIMLVMCRKHRQIGRALDRSVRLVVRRGRVESWLPSERPPFNPGDAYEGDL